MDSDFHLEEDGDEEEFSFPSLTFFFVMGVILCFSCFAVVGFVDDGLVVVFVDFFMAFFNSCSEDLGDDDTVDDDDDDDIDEEL